MAFDSGGGGGLRSSINVTPLVDVVLVLLIIFMCLSPPILKETDLKVPEESLVDLAPQSDDQLEVRVENDGTLKLSGTAIELPALVRDVRAAMTARAGRGPAAESNVVFFDVDDGASFGRVVEVFDACRGAGVQTLGLVPKQKAADDAAPKP